MGRQTLDWHQQTASPSRIWTYPSSPILKFQAHFPVSSSQRFKLLYILRKYHSKPDGACEQQCRLGTQTLDGQGRTASYLSTWTYPSPQLIRYAPHFPVSSPQRFKLLYILMKFHLKPDGTREQQCRLGSQTLDGHQQTASS
jgi:hypothetical protein